jgi:hypothetical protein
MEAPRMKGPAIAIDEAADAVFLRLRPVGAAQLRKPALPLAPSVRRYPRALAMKSKTLSVPTLRWIPAVVARRFNVSSGA